MSTNSQELANLPQPRKCVCSALSLSFLMFPDICQPAISKIDIYVTVILNVLTDLFLMSIPTPMLWKASLPARQKYFLLLMFSGGIFVMMAGILRCALILADPIKGAQAAGSWAVRETFVAVVIGNLLMIYPLIRKGLSIVVPGFTSQKSEFRVYGREPKSNQLRDRKSVHGGEKLRSLEATLTLSESEERIIGVAKQTRGIAVTTWTDVETSSRHEQVEDFKNSVDIAGGDGGYTAYVQKGDR